MPIKLVVFDMAGTTVKDDDNVHQALIEAFENEGILISREEANEVMGYPKPIAISHLLHLKLNGGLSGIHQYELIKRIHNNFVDWMVKFYKESPDVQEKMGVSDTFGKLKERDISIVTDTGFDRKIADTILDRMGWLKNKLIDGSITSDEVHHGRPFPDMVFKAMSLVKVKNASEVAKVGDTASDLLQGSRAGCGMVVGVTTGAFDRDTLKKQPHTHLIEEVPELLALI